MDISRDWIRLSLLRERRNIFHDQKNIMYFDNIVLRRIPLKTRFRHLTYLDMAFYRSVLFSVIEKGIYMIKKYLKPPYTKRV